MLVKIALTNNDAWFLGGHLHPGAFSGDRAFAAANGYHLAYYAQRNFFRSGCADIETGGRPDTIELFCGNSGGDYIIKDDAGAVLAGHQRNISGLAGQG